MKILLDTCTFLWIISDSAELSPRSRRYFVDPDNEVFLSSVSVWEIVMKHSIGKLPLPAAPRDFVREYRDLHQIEPLPLEEDAVFHLAHLPPHHRDPFDRMLICQAISQSMALLTPDPLITQYPVRTLW